MASELTHYWMSRLKSTHQQYHDVGERCEMRCRICGDSKKSSTKRRLNFYKATNSVTCWNCGYSHRVEVYVARVEGSEPRDVKLEAFKALGFRKTWDSVISQRDKHPEIIALQDFNAKQKVDFDWNYYDLKIPEEAKTWIDSRKFKDAPYLPENWQWRYDLKRDMLVFPWFLNKQVYYFQHRRYTENKLQAKYLFPIGYKRPLFGIDNINKDLPYIFITEAAFDAIWIKQCLAAGSIHLSSDQERVIRELYPQHNIVIMTDNYRVDSAARELTAKIANKYPKFHFFLFPKKYHQYKDVGAIASINTQWTDDFTKLDFLVENSYSAAKTLLLMRH